jgi:hypothetical protein
MRQPSPNETALEPSVLITEGEEILSELQEGDGGTVVNSKTKHAVVMSTEEHMTKQQGRKFPNHNAACVQVGNEERVQSHLSHKILKFSFHFLMLTKQVIVLVLKTIVSFIPGTSIQVEAAV